MKIKVIKNIDDIKTVEQLREILKFNGDVARVDGIQLYFLRNGDIFSFGNLKDGSVSDHGATPAGDFGKFINRHFNYQWGIYHSGNLEHVLSTTGWQDYEGPDKKFINECKTYFKKGVQRSIHLGVELELESTWFRPDFDKLGRQLNKLVPGLLQDVKGDCSVLGGTELVFDHSSFKDWKKLKVRKLLKDLKQRHFTTDSGTAGMHIHMSCPRNEDTVKIVEYGRENKDYILNNILYPICCRQEKVRGTVAKKENRYGMESNWTRGFTRHNTFEIRVWQATLNPDIIIRRVKFADYMARFFMKELPITEFFNQMTMEDKENYKFLLDTENPHVFGISKEKSMALLNMEA